LFTSKEPLFPFGYGLSYTSFEYGNASVEPATIGPNESAKVRLTVTNTGKRVGDEIVQLYIRDEVSSVTRPIKELRDFRRITLKPGEAQVVEFTIIPEKLAFYNREMKKVVEPGRFQIMVGASSANLKSVPLLVRE
jgi:beta-glucosidase